MWVWDAERDEVPVDGGMREMSGEGIEGCVWGMEVCLM